MGKARLTHASDRIVVVAAGFGVWQQGQHVVSARWTDVARARAIAGDAPRSIDSIELVLRDGSMVMVERTMPGFESFISAMKAALPGMLSNVSASPEE